MAKEKRYPDITFHGYDFDITRVWISDNGYVKIEPNDGWTPSYSLSFDELKRIYREAKRKRKEAKCQDQTEKSKI